MKKIFVLGLAALFMLVIIGCGDDGILKNEPDGPITSGDWKGLTNCVIETGDNPGEIKYKFSATDPAADSYTLYYMKGSISSAAVIMATGKQFGNSEPAAGGMKAVDPGDNFEKLSGLTAGTAYSVVIEALKGANDYSRSGVKYVTSKEKPQPFKLTIPDIDKATLPYTWGASLLDPDDTTTSVAIGVPDGTGKTFYFYHPKEGKPPVDTDRPFTTPGNYPLAVALTDPITYEPEAIYMYKENVTYGAGNTSITVNWSDFPKPTADNTVITVTGCPSNVTTLLVTDGVVPKAMGTKSGNTFALYEMGLTGANYNKPWKGSGNFGISLLANSTPVATYVKITGGGTSSTYTFTGQQTMTLNYASDFVAVSFGQ